MTRILVYTLEDESPRHIGHLADDLTVHQIAQADEGGCDAGADAHIVKHYPG